MDFTNVFKFMNLGYYNECGTIKDSTINFKKLHCFTLTNAPLLLILRCYLQRPKVELLIYGFIYISNKYTAALQVFLLDEMKKIKMLN